MNEEFEMTLKDIEAVAAEFAEAKAAHPKIWLRYEKCLADARSELDEVRNEARAAIARLEAAYSRDALTIEIESLRARLHDAEVDAEVKREQRDDALHRYTEVKREQREAAAQRYTELETHYVKEISRPVPDDASTTLVP